MIQKGIRGNLTQMINAPNNGPILYSERKTKYEPCWAYLVEYEKDLESNAANEDKAYSLHINEFAAQNYSADLPWVSCNTKRVYISESLLNKLRYGKKREIFVKSIEN